MQRMPMLSWRNAIIAMHVAMSAMHLNILFVPSLCVPSSFHGVKFVLEKLHFVANHGEAVKLVEHGDAELVGVVLRLRRGDIATVGRQEHFVPKRIELVIQALELCVLLEVGCS